MMNPDTFLVARLGLALLDKLPARSHGGHVVLVTSANVGEGKSFVARILANGTLQQARPPGVLIGIADGPSAPAGTLPRGKLFLRDELQLELGVLRQHHALSVVDGPALSKCGALLQCADAVVLVIDARETSPQAVRRAMVEAGVDPSRFCGAVLNHVPRGNLVRSSD